MIENPQTVLQEYLARYFADPNLQVVEFNELITGWSRKTYSLTVQLPREQRFLPLIVQVERERSLIQESDVAQDFAVFQALKGYGLPVPKAYCLEVDSSLLGGRFMVLHRLDGKCYDPLTSSDRNALADHWKRQTRLPESVLSTLISIHSVPTDLVSFLPGVPSAEETGAYEIGRCRVMARQIGMDRDPYTSFALTWLERNIPKEGWLSLLHGDFYLRNLLIQGEAVSGVLDWEVARISNPLMDVAHMCIPYTVGKFLKPGSPLAMGVFPREWVLREYIRRTGRNFSAETFRFWLVLSTLDLLLIVSAGVTGFQQGSMPDMRSAWLRFAEPALREDLLNAVLSPATLA